MTDHLRDDTLAELAVGALAGAERALAFHHVVGCDECLVELTQLARATDELLLLAPSQEPPAGFESTVMVRIAEHDARDPRRRRHIAPFGWSSRRILASVAAAALGATFAAGAVWQSTAADRHAAGQERETMRIGAGSDFKALPVTTSGGARAGAVFLYQGDPPWILVSLASAPVDGRYEMSVIDRDGAVYRGGYCEVEHNTGTKGYRLVRPVADIAAIELIGPGGVRLSARG